MSLPLLSSYALFVAAPSIGGNMPFAPVAKDEVRFAIRVVMVGEIAD